MEGREPRDDQPLLGPEDGQAHRPRRSGCRCLGATLCCLSGLGLAVGVAVYLAAMCTFSEGTLGDGRPFPSLPTCAAVSPLTAYVSIAEGVAQAQRHRCPTSMSHAPPQRHPPERGGPWVAQRHARQQLRSAAPGGEEGEPDEEGDAEESKAQEQREAAALAEAAATAAKRAGQIRPQQPLQQTPAQVQPGRVAPLTAKAKTGKVAPRRPREAACRRGQGQEASGQGQVGEAGGAPSPGRGPLRGGCGSAGSGREARRGRPAHSRAGQAGVPLPHARGSPLAPSAARFLAGFEDQFSVYVHTDDPRAWASQDLPPVFVGREIPGTVRFLAHPIPGKVTLLAK